MGSVPVRKHWRRAHRGPQTARRGGPDRDGRRSRRAAGSAERGHLRPAGHGRESARSAAPSARRSSQAAGMPLGVDHLEIDAVRPRAVRPAARVKRAAERPAPAVGLDGEERLVAGPRTAASSQPGGETPWSSRLSRISACRWRRASAAMERRARRHLRLDRPEPERIGALPRAAGCAGAWPFRTSDTDAEWPGIASSPAGRGSGGGRWPGREQPIHRRGQPEHAQIVAHLVDGVAGRH